MQFVFVCYISGMERNRPRLTKVSQLPPAQANNDSIVDLFKLQLEETVSPDLGICMARHGSSKA